MLRFFSKWPWLFLVALLALAVLASLVGWNMIMDSARGAFNYAPAFFMVAIIHLHHKRKMKKQFRTLK